MGIFIYVNQILNRLDDMLESAISGELEESTFDESKLSRLESKLAKFLSMSQIAKERVQEERDGMTQTVSDISHQTKTPIANIKMYTELLQEMNLGEEERVMADRIASQTERLNFITQSLVKLSRLENGIIQMKPCAQEMCDLVKDLVEAYQGKIKEKNLSLMVEDVDEMVCATYDYKWTREAVANILDNAVKYTPSGGTITIRVKAYEMFHAIEIEDTGIGILEEEQAKIFQRFYRGQEVNQQEGVGIGLYLARKIVSLEGGYIRVRSEKGKGTLFGVYLKGR
nr:HAMP domain-containing histidine kinase [Eubacterium sp.]